METSHVVHRLHCAGKSEAEFEHLLTRAELRHHSAVRGRSKQVGRSSTSESEEKTDCLKAQRDQAWTGGCRAMQGRKVYPDQFTQVGTSIVVTDLLRGEDAWERSGFIGWWSTLKRARPGDGSLCVVYPHW